MSKRSLMLSTAAIAIMTGSVLADTKIDSSKTSPYTTGAKLSGQNGEENAGNITVTSAGSVAVSGQAQGAVVVDTNNWILNQGAISNKDKDNAEAIHIDLSSNRDLSAASFTNAAGATVTGYGLYIDTGSAVSVSGSGTGKSAISFDAANCSAATCTYKGNILTDAGSSVSVTGDSSQAININSKAVLLGNVTIGGAVSATANSSSQSATNVYGIYSSGQIDGNFTVAAGGTVYAYGAGAQGITLLGNGVTGSVEIGGTVATTLVPDLNYNYTQKINTTTNPEAGPALYIGSNIGHGIAILGPTAPNSTIASGTLSMTGSSSTVVIAPNSASTSPLVIGLYTADLADPGFSFYNRGSVTASYANYNAGNTAMTVAATSDVLPTVLSGGLFNSGSMTSSVLTSGSGVSTGNVYATGVYIGPYVQLQVGSGKNAASGTSAGDQAALVNSGAIGSSSGTISASVTGSRGGKARAIYIESGASVPSLINTGNIYASATTSDATLTGNSVANSSNPLSAVAIYDGSGSLTSIYNSGTISATAGYESSGTGSGTLSPLDNNSQSAIAIGLGGGATSASASGVQIKNYSSATRAASITGDIIFGTGNNQVLDLQGNGPSLASIVTGNISYGMIASGSTSGDRLHIGNYSMLTGEVTTQESVRGAGVQVDVDTHGVLNLLNTSASLNATSFNVANGGTVNLGVNKSLTATGGVVAAQQVNFQAGSVLGVTYSSFVPQTEHQFVLMTADTGQLAIGQNTLDTFNSATNRPYLLAKATLCTTNTAGCAKPSSVPVSQDALVIDVVPKSATDLGLTAGSVPLRSIKTAAGTTTTFFDQANAALSIDNELGSAFINGIHSAGEAQKAYNNLAPIMTGGTRAIAISITDSATGPVGARQRALRMYGKTNGEMTLWGQEFVTMIKEPGSGAYDDNTGFKTNPGFRDHGFGFSLGLDGGSPKYGWYGGAVTFYAGDMNELSRIAHENQQWYLLSLYSSWRGKGLFVDTKLDAGYGHIDGTRSEILSTSSTTNYARSASNKHAGALLSGAVSTGVMMNYGAATIMPQLNLDGLWLREEGYTETNPGQTTVGDGFDMKVNQSYAKSLRVFAGLDLRYDLQLWDFFLQPEVRAGYRYDFISDPLKLRAAFAYADTSNPNKSAPGTEFDLIGPDPSRGNFVVGGTVAATTDTWTLGLNFDLARASNGAFQQTATVNLVGRI